MKKLLMIISILISLGFSANASHIAGCDLSYTCLSGNTYLITLTFYRDCSGIAEPGSTSINFTSSCQSFSTVLYKVAPTAGVEVTPACPGMQTTCNGGSLYGIKKFVYQGQVTLPACANWTMSYSLGARNPSNTIQNPTSANMYIEAKLNNLVAPCNSSPVFSNPPSTIICSGQQFCFNHGAIDPDGDSLVYSMVTPFNLGPGSSTPYVIYLPGYSAQQPLPSSPPVTIDPVTGDICMTPTQNITTVFAVLVEEWRTINGVPVMIGSVLRDMQLAVIPCSNLLPTLSGINPNATQYNVADSNYTLNVCLGDTIDFSIFSRDIDVPAQNLTMTWNSGIPAGTWSVTGNNTPNVTGHFYWVPAPGYVSNSPYCFTVTIQDDHCPYFGTQIFSYCLTVTGINVDLNQPHDTTLCIGTPMNLIASHDTNALNFYWYVDGVLTTPVNDSTFFVNTNLLGPGVHTIQVEADNGILTYCKGHDYINITVGALPIVTFSQISNVCMSDTPFALTQGNPSGGTYSGPGVTNGVFSPNAAGPGTWMLTYYYSDANHCSATATQNITVNQNPVVVFAPLSSVCTNTPPFQLTSATPSGGNYTGTGVSNNIFSPAVADSGTFTITYIYTNSSNCSDTATQDIKVNYVPTSLFTVTTPLCSFSDSSLITYTGNAYDTANYSWNFDGGSVNPSGGGNGPFHVEWTVPGIKTVTLTVTQNGCTSASSSQQVAVSNIQTAMTPVSDVLCYGGNNGSATVTASSGISPYHYLWNTTPVQNTATANNLQAGTYIVSVTDTSGCFASDTVTITEPTQLYAQIDTTTKVNCFGGSDAWAHVNAGGGTQPYQYSWSAGTPNGPLVNGLTAGNYTVTVRDSNNCTVVVPFSITQNPPLNLNLMPTDEGCAGECNGSVASIASGGVPPYHYHWSTAGNDTLMIMNLCTGNYSLTLTDSLGCTLQAGPATIATNTLINAYAGADPQEGILPMSVNFSSSGNGATIYYWDFGDGSNSAAENPSHTYNTDGTFTISLTVNSGIPDFCEDKVTITVIVHKPSSIIIPNVFTPNGDGSNDEFRVKSEGLVSESMVIYNRWGKKMYEWNVVNGSWNGLKEGGAQSSDGVYYYIFTARGFDKSEYNNTGTVTLLR